MRMRAQERVEQKLEVGSRDRLPPPVTDIKEPSHSQGYSFPIPLDSDSEAEFANGHSHPQSAQRSGRPSHISILGHSTRASTITSQDIHHAFTNRRTWIASQADGDSGDDIPRVDYGAATPDPPPDPEASNSERSGAKTPQASNPVVPPSPSTLFTRLRTASFSPFASMRRSSRIFAGRGDGNATHEINTAMASSESSSDDDDLSILSRRTWRRNNNAHQESYSEDDEYDATEALEQ